MKSIFRLNIQPPKLIFLALLFIFCRSIKAQDTIALKEGRKIPAIVMKVNSSVIKFKLINVYSKNLLYKLTSEVSYIKYKNNTIQNFETIQDTIPVKLRRNYFYTNVLSLTLNCEPNLSYERRFKEKLGISIYTGYKFENFLGRAVGPTGIDFFADQVRFCYQGPRAILGFKYYTTNKKFFIGLTVGLSDLKIRNKSFYGGANSDAEMIEGLNSNRRDLDYGITFGKNNLFKRFQVYVTFGLRNIWVTTTYTSHRPGEPVGGELAPFTNPIVNGYMGYMLYQAGINYVFVSR